MKYTPQIEQKIITQIEATPDLEVILPDWAYWKGVDQPWVYVDSVPIRLVRVLYERLIASLPDGAGLSPRPGTSPRSVNPYLWVVTPSRHSRAQCANHHAYTEDDWIEGVGYRCQTCRAEQLLGTPSATDLNRLKTHCPYRGPDAPNGHPLSGDNLINLKNGRRRCRTCHAATQARYRARQNGTA